MRRLYLQVYLTLVASLLVFVLVAGVFWRELADRAGYGQFAGLASEVVEAVLPPQGDPQAAQEAALRRWAERISFPLDALADA